MCGGKPRKLRITSSWCSATRQRRSIPGGRDGLSRAPRPPARSWGVEAAKRTRGRRLPQDPGRHGLPALPGRAWGRLLHPGTPHSGGHAPSRHGADHRAQWRAGVARPQTPCVLRATQLHWPAVPAVQAGSGKAPLQRFRTRPSPALPVPARSAPSARTRRSHRTQARDRLVRSVRPKVPLGLVGAQLPSRGLGIGVGRVWHTPEQRRLAAIGCKRSSQRCPHKSKVWTATGHNVAHGVRARSKPGAQHRRQYADCVGRWSPCCPRPVATKSAQDVSRLHLALGALK